MELDLGEEPGKREAVLELQGPQREKALGVAAEAIVAVVLSVKEREKCDESSSQS
jgi:hypothetical protein